MDEDVPRRHIEIVVHTVGIAQDDKCEIRSEHWITEFKCSVAIVRIVDLQTERANMNLSSLLLASRNETVPFNVRTL